MNLLLFEPIKDIHHLRSRLLLYYPLFEGNQAQLDALMEADQYLQIAARLWLLDVVYRFVEHMRELGLEAEIIVDTEQVKSSDAEISTAFLHYINRCREKLAEIPNDPRFIGIKSELSNLDDLAVRFRDYINNSEQYIAEMTEKLSSEDSSAPPKQLLH